MKKIACTLLVDDDDTTNFINQMLLKDLGITHEILITHNGKEAMDLIQQRQLSNQDLPDLIILDINMPVMNGFEFLEAFEKIKRKGNPSVIIVMLSTSMNPEDVSDAEGTAIKEFLNKPLTEHSLKEVVNKHFSS
jgi:CheY-like chemotaxis protein